MGKGRAVHGQQQHKLVYYPWTWCTYKPRGPNTITMECLLLLLLQQAPAALSSCPHITAPATAPLTADGRA